MRFSLSAMIAMMALSVPTVSVAKDFSSCEWLGNPANIMEPWEENTRSFANGAIRVAALDTGGEPACCSSHLLILFPSPSFQNEPVYRQCLVMSDIDELGFYSVDVAGIAASYDPASGLLLSVPVGFWHQGMDNGAGPNLGRISIRINQASGTVVFE